MKPGDEYQYFERVIADAFTSDDPAAALRRAAGDRHLSPALRAALRCADARGVQMTAVLVARLRFERLLQGSLIAAEWFAQAPAGFARAFRHYHTQVAPTALEPKAEAALFQQWLDRG